MTGEHRIGEMFDGRYQLERRIGSGGMADVFLAHGRLLDRESRSRSWPTATPRDPGFVERFRREARRPPG